MEAKENVKNVTIEKKWYQKKLREMDGSDKAKLAAVWIVCISIVVICMVWACGGFSSPKPKYTYGQYNQIQIGMTYMQVVNVLGENGEQTSYTGDASYNLAMYTWTHVSPYQSIVVLFENGRVSSKSQLGLGK